MKKKSLLARQIFVEKEEKKEFDDEETQKCVDDKQIEMCQHILYFPLF